MLGLAIVYLTLSIGVGKSTHFCLGREHHTTLFSFDEKCACAAYPTKKSCCKDETQLVKIQDDHNINSNALSFSATYFLLAPLYLSQLATDRPVFTKPKTNTYRSPPQKVPIYQSGCSLLLYDSLV
jgi:hypothetical protein